MAVTDELARARAALQMINPAPFNAEAPPEALHGEITPTDFHYVRSNFALPVHDGTLEIGGAVEHPVTVTLDDLRAMPARERAVTLECAGNGRLQTRPLPIGEPWGDYAVSTARWSARGRGVCSRGRCRSASRGATTPCRPRAGRAPFSPTSWSRCARLARASTCGSRAPTRAPTTSTRSWRTPTGTTCGSSAPYRSPSRRTRRRRS